MSDLPSPNQASEPTGQPPQSPPPSVTPRQRAAQAGCGCLTILIVLGGLVLCTGVRDLYERQTAELAAMQAATLEVTVTLGEDQSVADKLARMSSRAEQERAATEWVAAWFDRGEHRHVPLQDDTPEWKPMQDWYNKPKVVEDVKRKMREALLESASRRTLQREGR